MKKAISHFSKLLCFVLVTVILTAGICFAEEKPIFVLVDGEKVEFDVNPIIKNDVVMVPVRAIFEKFSAQVLWDPFFERVIINISEDDQIIMYVHDGEVYRNNVYMHLDEPAFFHENRTFVPIGFINDCFGDSVEWSSAFNTVYIVPQEKAMQFIPYGEFLTIPSPMSVNRNYKVLDYKNEDGVAVATFSLNGEKTSDFERYSALMDATGFKLIKEADENDATVIYYGKGVVLKLLLLEDNETFTTTIYQDVEGTTIKDYIVE